MHPLSFALWLPFFSLFHSSRKTKNLQPFFAKNEKKTKKILPIKIVKVTFAITNFSIFWLVKICRQGFFHILLFLKVEYARDFVEFWKNHQKLPKFGQKWAKNDFSFFVPHFSAKNEELKKPKNEKFFVSVGPIIGTYCSTDQRNYL